MNHIIVGAFFETPDGRIARTYGASRLKVMYYFDDGEGGREADQAEYQTWKIRNDLRDFPNARDPRLPYVFDLFWDIKYMSDLKRELDGHEDEDEIRDCMRNHGITLGDENE